LQYKLRLKGDEFKVIQKQENKIFKLTTDSQIMFCKVVRTTTPDIPEDMSNFAYFNLGVVDGKTGTIYEITSANTIHYIDQVSKVVPEQRLSSVRGGGVCIYWKNGKKSTFMTAIPEEADELIEVVGAHLKRFNNSTIKQVQLLKDIFKCKSTVFNPTIPEHEKLLKRLWQVIKPEEELKGMIHAQWKSLGFQGNDPATDFRGMGLLGLLNLIYFAEHYTERVRQLVEANRDYPWAATGINITNMLMNMLKLTKELVEEPAPSRSWQSPLLQLFYYADNDDTFDELYSQSFLLLDSLWVHMKAGYMDFPTVIERLRGLIEDMLKRKPLDINQLIAWMDQLQLSYTVDKVSIK